jgi:hypothetical protein
MGSKLFGMMGSSGGASGEAPPGNQGVPPENPFRKNMIGKMKTAMASTLMTNYREVDGGSFDSMMRINAKMTGRASRGDQARRYILYPDDKIKGVWELFTTV